MPVPAVPASPSAPADPDWSLRSRPPCHYRSRQPRPPRRCRPPCPSADPRLVPPKTHSSLAQPARTRPILDSTPASLLIYWILEQPCRSVPFNRIIVIVQRPTGSGPAWKPRTGVPFFLAAGPGGGRNSRSAPRGSSPSLVFRNVPVCCDRRISEESTTRVAVTPVPFSRLFWSASRSLMVLESVSLCPAPSAKPWCATASGGVSGRPSAVTWIG